MNQRIQEPNSWTLTTWRHPIMVLPHRIRTDTLQILNLLPAANWASGVLSWPYYYYPILAYSVSNPIHRAVEKYCHTIVVATLIVTHLRLEEGCLESKHRYLVRWETRDCSEIGRLGRLLRRPSVAFFVFASGTTHLRQPISFMSPDGCEPRHSI